MARRCDNKGFTLVELLLVMVIIATLAALATPALRGFTRSRLLPNTAQELVLATRWCKVQAITDGVAYHLNLDSQSNEWTITKDDGTGLNFQPIVSNFMPDTFRLPEGISLESNLPVGLNGAIYIAFEPNGRCDVGTVTLRSESVETLVTCDTPLGSYYVVKQVQ